MSAQRNIFKPEVTSYLRKDFVNNFGLLNPDYIEEIVQEHMNGKIDHRKKIWSILMFQYWVEKYY